MLLAWSTGGEWQTTAIIYDSREGHEPAPIGVHEQTLFTAPITSDSTTEEGLATKHHMLLLSLLWELTHSAAATANVLGTS